MPRDTPHLVIIADDLTGAGDCGLPFAAVGLKTIVVLSGPPPPADVVVINTASRGAPADLAAKRVAVAVRMHPAPWYYKKIDSTLRGHVGVELDAMMKATARKLAFVAPAFPAQGRVVRGGRVFINDMPLEGNGAVGDQGTGFTCSSISYALGQSLAGQMIRFDLTRVREEIPGGAAGLAGFSDGVVICDAETDGDLRLIARAALAHPGQPLFCGSAGLAGALAHEMAGNVSMAGPASCGRAPTLFVAGSRHPVTFGQCQQAEKGGMRVIRLSPSRLAGGNPGHGAVNHAAASLIAGQDTLLAVDASEGFIRDRSARIAGALSGAALQVILAARPGSLVLTGGDVAEMWCRQASVSAIHILKPIMAGIPAARLIGGVADGLALATKAGGFGPPDAFTQIAAYFRRST